MSALVIIEAPGKVRALSHLLADIGMPGLTILATIGHIGENPARFNPLGVDSQYRETAYRLRPDRALIAEQIREVGADAHLIYLATDDDQEGDVIARDVARFCLSDRDQGKLRRVRLRALTADELRASFESADAFDPLAAARGDARRVLDRLIGSLSNARGAVGRVQGSMLLALRDERPVVGTMTYTAPAADGGSPWLATVPVHAGLARPREIEASMPLRPGAVMMGTVTDAPMNHDEIVLAVSLRSGESIKDVSRAMQSLYEDGDMTYPRAKDRLLSPQALRRVIANARMAGAAFDADAFNATRGALGGLHAHEAPNAITVDVPVNRAWHLLSLKEQVLVTISQHLMGCGQACQIETPDPDSLLGLPPEISDLPWQRGTAVAAFHWDMPGQLPGLQTWTQEQSLLHFASTHGLGRPSTVVPHVEKFLSRELVTRDFELTPKGIAWCEQIAGIFGNQNISALVEQYLDAHLMDSATMVSEMISLCGLRAIDDALRTNSVASGRETNYDDDIEISAGLFC